MINFGVIPAAGKAKRMHGLPKSLLPLPDGTLLDTLYVRMLKAQPHRFAIGASYALSCLIEKSDIYGKIVQTLFTSTMTETVLQLEDVRHFDDLTMLGMPDTYFEDEQAFVKLAVALDDGADVAVGLFLTRPEQRSKLGMCDFDTTTQQITRVIDKPESTELVWAWGVLAWKPVFWDCLDANEPHVGYGLPRAIEYRLDVRAACMEGGYWDCGTSEEYFSLIRYLTGEKVEA